MQKHTADMSDAEWELWLDSLFSEPPNDDEDWRLVAEADDDNPDDSGAVDMLDSPVYDRR